MICSARRRTSGRAQRYFGWWCTRLQRVERASQVIEKMGRFAVGTLYGDRPLRVLGTRLTLSTALLLDSLPLSPRQPVFPRPRSNCEQEKWSRGIKAVPKKGEKKRFGGSPWPANELHEMMSGHGNFPLFIKRNDDQQR